MTGGAGRSHEITNGVTGGGDVAFWANIIVAMELVVACPVAMETCGPVVYMGIQKGFIILGEG